MSGANAANTFVVNTDRIADYGSVLISASDYGFNAAVVTENVNSKIVDALSFETLTSIGPITNVAILFANATFATVPTLEAESAQYQSNSTTQHVYSSQSIGRIKINNGLIKTFNAKKGDILLWNGNIVHRGELETNQESIRHSLTGHFVGSVWYAR